MKINYVVPAIVACVVLGCGNAAPSYGRIEMDKDGQQALLAERAKLPYSALCNIAGVNLQLQGLGSVTNQERRMWVRSDLPGVKPGDIELYINSTNGRIPLNVAPDSTIKLPVRDDLLKEDPFVVANQPKGTLKLESTVSVTSVGSGGTDAFPIVRDGDRVKARYSQFFKTLAAVPDSARLTVKGEPEALPDVPIGKEVRLSAKGCEPGASLIIHSKAGDRAIAADPQGAFVITWDPDLYREDPWVSFPQAARNRPAQP
jgi:hypothetical protein